LSKSKKPIPFRSPKQQAAVRKGVETRARRHYLCELAKRKPSFER
jgi:hypothetical protein